MSEKNVPLGASNATKSRSTDAGKVTSVKNSQTSAAKAETTGSGSHSSPKKRRKVNHGKVPLRSMRQGSGPDSVAHNDKNIFANERFPQF
ncbi:hypothetical protein N7501_007872 [Penicillium viridicatum]|nr:hypothetical protein N7501_007872 [Penicillium viridicatum]